MRKAAFPSRTLARQGGLAGLFFLLSSVAAFAQFDTAAVLGTVRDRKRRRDRQRQDYRSEYRDRYHEPDNNRCDKGTISSPP